MVFLQRGFYLYYMYKAFYIYIENNTQFGYIMRFPGIFRKTILLRVLEALHTPDRKAEVK